MSDANMYLKPTSISTVIEYHEHKARVKAADAVEYNNKAKNNKHGNDYYEACEGALEARRKELWHRAAADLLHDQCSQEGGGD